MESLVYVGLGGNIGDSIAVLQRALEEICKIEEVRDVCCSNFYQTSPVLLSQTSLEKNFVKQRDYVNAVCCFKTTLSAEVLFCALEEIEKRLGKVPKPKSDPRVIDLDLLLFGKERIQKEDLNVPHPFWDKRLFVLFPLLDLAKRVWIPAEKEGELPFEVDLLQRISFLQKGCDEKVKFLIKPKI